jgi:hypothetical protein
MGIQLNGLSTVQEMVRIQRIASELPGSGKFIVNYSQGFWETCAGSCSAATIGTTLHPPLERAYCAADWKMLTHARWGDFLVATAAGNERGEESAAIYPGMAVAPYTSALSMATLGDPSFASVQDPGLWGANAAYVGYPSLAATDAEAADLAEYVRTLGLDTVGPAQNVLVTGSTTRADHVASLEEMPDSDSGPDVKAVGQDVFTLQGWQSGTSLAAPQVAGLASYLWLLSPDLRIRPAQDTRQAILANARGNANTDGIIDAYASVLSLDQAVAPTPATAPIRLAILDVDENGVFDESDVELYLRRYYDTAGAPQETADCGRFDLNGDCLTGGSATERFDLDRAGSVQYGQAAYTAFTRAIEGKTVPFDERALTDTRILCYYAYTSGFFQGDTTRRKALLELPCTEGARALDVTYALADGSTDNPYCDDDIRVGVEKEFGTPVSLPVRVTPTCGVAHSDMTLRRVAPGHIAMDFSLFAQGGDPAGDSSRNGAVAIVEGHIPAGDYTVRFAPEFVFSPAFVGQEARYLFDVYPRDGVAGFPDYECTWKNGSTTGWSCALPLERDITVPAGREYVWTFTIYGYARQALDTVSLSGEVLSIRER